METRNTITKDMGEEIFKYLNDLSGGKLPSTGYLAGGAVANLINARAHGSAFHDAVVNDIDVFDMKPLNYNKCTSINVVGSRHCYDGYPLFSHFSKNIYYTVLNTNLDGIINTITTQTNNYSFNSNENMMTLLNGFDFNACQACLDIETRNIVITDNFYKFIESQQLLVTSYNTPHHTICRMAKKVDDLSCYCDIKSEVQILTAYSDYHYYRLKNEYLMYISTCFGPKHYEMYKKYKEKLDDYINLNCVNVDLGLYNFTSKSPIIVDLEKELGENLDNIPIHQIANLFAVQLRPSVKALDKSRMLWAMHSGPFTAECASGTHDYLNNIHAHHNRQLTRINRYVVEHPDLATLFLNYKFTAEEQIATIRAVDKYGLLIIGALECLNLNVPKLTINAEFYKALASGEITGTEKLVEPIDLSEFAGKESVKELVYREELIAEGIKQRHCVGGYSKKVMRGECRIFHISVEDQESTIEVRPNGNIQHKGFANSSPTKSSKDVADELLAFMKIEAIAEGIPAGELHDDGEDVPNFPAPYVPETQRTPKAPTFEVHGPADTSIVLQDNIIYDEMTSGISSCATGSAVVHE